MNIHIQTLTVSQLLHHHSDQQPLHVQGLLKMNISINRFIIQLIKIIHKFFNNIKSVTIWIKLLSVCTPIVCQVLESTSKPSATTHFHSHLCFQIVHIHDLNFDIIKLVNEAILAKISSTPTLQKYSNNNFVGISFSGLLRTIIAHPAPLAQHNNFDSSFEFQYRYFRWCHPNLDQFGQYGANIPITLINAIKILYVNQLFVNTFNIKHTSQTLICALIQCIGQTPMHKFPLTHTNISHWWRLYNHRLCIVITTTASQWQLSEHETFQGTLSSQAQRRAAECTSS